MTARQKSLLGYAAVIVTLTGAVVGTVAWTYQKAVAEPLARKVDVVRFELDSVNRDNDAKDLRGMTLDILCSKKVEPENRRCK